MNRPRIFIVPPERIDAAWPSIESLPLVVPAVADESEAEQVLKVVREEASSGNEELHVVVDSAGETVACFSAREGKDHSLLVRMIAGKNEPVWIGFILRNIHELAAARGLSYAKVVSKAF